MRFENKLFNLEEYFSDTFDSEKESRALLILSLFSFVIVLILYFTGGITNPLYILYYLNLNLGSVLLTKLRGYYFLLVTLFCLVLTQGLTFINHVGLNISLLKELAPIFITQHVVLLLAWGFGRQLRDIIQRKNDKVIQIKLTHVKKDRLRALGSLTAGFSHEFASPLNTIKILLENEALQNQSSNVEQALIATQMCEEILHSMNNSQLDVRDLEFKLVNTKESIEQILTVWRKINADFTIDNLIEENINLNLPELNFAQMIVNILDNSYEASPGGKMRIESQRQNNEIVISFTDQGPGFTQEVLLNFGQPFLTTKSEGIGLGLYASELFMTSVGGRLSIENTQQGACVKAHFDIQTESKKDEKTINNR